MPAAGDDATIVSTRAQLSSGKNKRYFEHREHALNREPLEPDGSIWIGA